MVLGLGFFVFVFFVFGFFVYLRVGVFFQQMAFLEERLTGDNLIFFSKPEKSLVLCRTRAGKMDRKI